MVFCLFRTLEKEDKSMKNFLLVTLIACICVSITPTAFAATKKQAKQAEETVEALVPPPPYDQKPESKVEIASQSKKPKEAKVTLSPNSIEYDVTTFIKPTTLSLTDFMNQFAAYNPEYVVSVDKEEHCLRVGRKTFKPKADGIQSVTLSFAADKDLLGEEHPVAITIIGVRSGNDPHKKYKRTFKMPEEWGSQIKVEGYDECIYMAQFNVLHQLLEAIVKDPTGNNFEEDQKLFCDFTYEKYQD